MEKTVDLSQTSEREALDAVLQMRACFTHYGLSREAQDATWRSVKHLISWALVEYAEIQEEERVRVVPR